MNATEPTTGTGHWSAAEDRPAYLEDAPRPRRRVENMPASRRWALPAVLAVLAGAAVALLFGVERRDDTRRPETSPPGTAAPAASTPTTPAAPSSSAGPRYELKPRAEEPLPALEASDPLMGKSISGLVGRHVFERFVIPDMIVRHIVATVDNLPRPTGSTRTVPLRRVEGTLAVSAAGIAPANARRYAPYVRIFASIDAHALAERYAATYPLFERAYEELGYPGGSFNDRLIGAIDDLLAAPELDAGAKVVPSPVIYKFADPDLEGRSAGQKIMMRMGRENAVAVKAKLREIRGEIVALARR
jgi:DUF3014 family protein